MKKTSLLMAILMLAVVGCSAPDKEVTPGPETPVVETPAVETPVVETPVVETPIEEPVETVVEEVVVDPNSPEGLIASIDLELANSVMVNFEEMISNHFAHIPDGKIVLTHDMLLDKNRVAVGVQGNKFIISEVLVNGGPVVILTVLSPEGKTNSIQPSFDGDFNEIVTKVESGQFDGDQRFFSSDSFESWAN